MAYDRAMRTLGPLGNGLVVGLVLLSYSHPSPAPRAPEPDDERSGAIELVWDDATKNFAAEGALDARAGDAVDWYTLALPPGEKSSFTVWVQGTGSTGKLPLTIEIVTDHMHRLALVSAEAHTSAWRLESTHGHDLEWLGANARWIEIPPLPACRGGDVVVPRR